MTKQKLWKGFKSGTKLFGNTIATLINTILLTLVYFIGVGITTLFAKIRKKHFLQNKPTSKDSYWSDLNLKKQPMEKYYRQF
tara:strand:- start:186 stop:431 length:246 start_codon:yes stop_codon:yes gene_type:complete